MFFSKDGEQVKMFILIASIQHYIGVPSYRIKTKKKK